MYLPTTTGLSGCHSPLPDKRKLFCLFVCRDTLPYYGVGAFSLPILHGMHLVVPTQFCFFWVICHPSRTFPLKESEQEPQNRFFPSPHRQTMLSYLWLMTSPCPVLAGYRLVMSGPCVCLSFMYIQNLPATHAFAVVGLHSLPSVFWLFFGFPFFYGLLHSGAGPCLTMGFAFLQPTIFSATISCHTTLSFLLRICLPQSCWASLGLPFILLPMAQYGH